MNDIASMRKMRPLEPAGSCGSFGAGSGFVEAVSCAGCFLGGKWRFYQGGSIENVKSNHGFARMTRIKTKN
jgi:hypothetical protein